MTKPFHTQYKYIKGPGCVKSRLCTQTFPWATHENLYVAKRHNSSRTLQSSSKDRQAVMTLWGICRVRLGGHVTKAEGYDIKTPPLLLCGSFFPPDGAGQKSRPATPRGTTSLTRTPSHGRGEGGGTGPGTQHRQRPPLRVACLSPPLQA